MSYGSYRHIIHQALSGDTTDTFRFEIQKKDFLGSSVEWKGSAERGVFSHHWDEIDPDDIYSNPVQKSELELHCIIQNSSDFSVLEEIFGADEDEFRMVKKINGVQVWEGNVIPGLLRHQERNYPLVMSAVAKDLSFLKGEDFPLEDNRETVITTLSQLLPYEMPIHTYTSWQTVDMAVTDDFLNELYHDTIVFRTIDGSSSLSEEPWSKFEVIEAIAKAGKLIIIQGSGRWNIYQLSALGDPTSVREFIYNSAGVLQSNSLVDITTDVDRQSLYILPSSVNEYKEALKESRFVFKHQSGSSEVEFKKIPGTVYPGGAVDTVDDEYYLASQPFTGNGDEKLKFNGRIDQNVNSTSGQDSFISITIGDYFLNDNSVWKNEYTGLIEGRADELDINTTTGEIQFFVDVFGDSFENNKPVRLTTSGSIPDGFQEFKTYYIVELTDGPTSDQKKFKLSLTPNGSAVIPEDDGVGTLYCHLIQIDIDLFISSGVSTGNIIDILTSDIPDSAEGNLEIYLPAFAVGDFNSVYWFNVSASIENPTLAGEEIEYRLTQDGIYSFKKGKDDIQSVYFGDGPFDYSRSSYRYSAAISDVTYNGYWERRDGSISASSHANLWLKEELDLRRSARRDLQSQLYGTFNVNKILAYDNMYFFFLGGSQDGYNNLVNGVFFELNIETDG